MPAHRPLRMLTATALAGVLALLHACSESNKAPVSISGATLASNTREASMTTQELEYRDKHVVIHADMNPPQITIDGEAIAVARNNVDSFTATQHLPFASFTSLEELARKVIDLQATKVSQ